MTEGTADSPLIAAGMAPTEVPQEPVEETSDEDAPEQEDGSDEGASSME